MEVDPSFQSTSHSPPPSSLQSLTSTSSPSHKQPNKMLQEGIQTALRMLRGKECSPGCSQSLLENSECDLVCNTSACSFDHGMCVYCSEYCLPQFLGNGECDHYCNTEACNYDMNDCSQSQATLYHIISIAGFCLIAAVFLW